MDYDNDYLGVGNSQHPANQPDLPHEHEKELTIREAFETGYEDKLLEAISRQEKLNEHIISELDFFIGVLNQTENTWLKNRLIKLKKQLP